MIDFKKIERAAENIRVIENFAQKHNFNDGLILSPSQNNLKKNLDLPILCAFSFLFILVLLMTFTKLNPSLPEWASFTVVLFEICLCTLIIMCVHKKFDNSMLTTIASAGVVIIFLIGNGLITPMEAAQGVKDTLKK